MVGHVVAVVVNAVHAINPSFAETTWDATTAFRELESTRSQGVADLFKVGLAQTEAGNGLIAFSS